MPAHRPMRGFTLLELLVATTLLALVSLTVLLGMRIGFRAWQKAQQRLETEAQEAAVEEYLGRALASAVAYRAVPGEEDLPASFVPFEATSEGLRWLTTYTTAWRERSGLTLVECFIARDGDDRRLVIQQSPVRGDGILVREVLAQARYDAESGQQVFVYRPFVPAEGTRTLVASVRNVRFQFLKVTPGESSWQADWDGARENKLPAAVRLLVETSGGERSWTVPIRSEVVTP